MGKLSLQHSSQYSTLVSQVRPDQREDRLCTGKKGDSNRFFFLHATGICWEPRGGSVEVWLRETNLRDSLNASRLGNRYLEVGSSTHLKGSQALFVHFIKLSLQCSRYLRLGCHFKGGRGRTHVVGVAATHVGQRTPYPPHRVPPMAHDLMNQHSGHSKAAAAMMCSKMVCVRESCRQWDGQQHDASLPFLQ